jgi:hypothetical protein
MTIRLQVAILLIVVIWSSRICLAAVGESKSEQQKETVRSPVLPVLCGGVKEVPVVVDVVDLNAEAASTQLECCAPGSVKTAREEVGVESLCLRLLGKNAVLGTVCIALNGQQKSGVMLRDRQGLKGDKSKF